MVITGAAALLACSSGSDDVGASADGGADQSDAGSDAAVADTGPPPPPEFCEGTVAHLHEPLGPKLLTFPDDAYTVEDPASPTGLRLKVDESVAPWVLDISELIRPNLLSMGRLSGFGTGAGVVLRFDGPVSPLPSGAMTATSDAAMWWDLGTTPATRVPFTAQLQADGQTTIAYPLRPMRPGTRHAFVVTRQHPTAEGGCIAPAPVTRGLLTGVAADVRLERLLPRYAELLERTGLAADDISAAVVFTTHDDTQVFDGVVEDIAGRTYAWDEAPQCAEEGGYNVCETAFVALDYRNDRIIDGMATPTEWTIPVTLWLPSGGTGPAPVLMVGHGINANRYHASAVAKHMDGLGFAIVAADALHHGEHPTALGGDPGDDAIRFLGVDLEAFTIDLFATRGNFNQTVIDRLQLAKLLAGAPDVDGDGDPDLNPERVGYFGISLGGLLGPGLMALTDDIEAGILTVAGGGLLNFALDSVQFSTFKPFVISLIGSEEEFDRLLAVIQSAVDAADPSTWARRVLMNRRPGVERVPSLLFNVALPDDTVPPSTGRDLARALEIPHVPPVVETVELLVVSESAPVEGNIADGEATAGFFQLDRVGAENVKPASHDGVPFSPEAVLQARRFLSTWLETSVGTIVDPYAELSTPPLP